MQINEPPRFLLDENLSQEIAAGLQRRDKGIDIQFVAGPGAPVKGSLDPDILRYCEVEHRILITNNRKSMPGHLAAFAAEVRHHWGIFQVRDAKAIGEIIEDFYLIWSATDASEHIDQVEWIPI